MRTHDPTAQGRPPADKTKDGRYDTQLIKADVERLLGAYLNQAGKLQGTRLVWTCPRCGKAKKLSLQRSTGAVGCMNAGCEVPDTTDAIGLIAHLEGLRENGKDFRNVAALCYRLLGLPDPTVGEGGAGADAAERSADSRTTESSERETEPLASVSQVPPAPAIPHAPTPADPETVDRVLSRLLELCPLEERDVRYLASRGVAEAAARTARFGSISKSRAAYVVRRLADEFDREELLGVPGFREDEGRGGRLGFTLWGDFVLVPYHDRDGRVATIEGRAVGEVPKWAGKYTSLRGGGNHLYVYPGFRVEDLVAICEGPMGAIVAAQEGLPVGAIQGVKRYTAAGEQAPLPELAGVDFGGRRLLYVPDVDVKPDAMADVEKHAPRACEWLISRQNGVARVATVPAQLARTADGAAAGGTAPKDLDEWILAAPKAGLHGVLFGLLASSVAPEDWSGIPDDEPTDSGAVGDPEVPAAEEALDNDSRDGAGDDGFGEGDEHPEAADERETEEGEEEPSAEDPEDGVAGEDPDAFERWYAVLEGYPGARTLVAAPKVYRPRKAGADVPADVFAGEDELQWSALVGFVGALVAWYYVGASTGWLMGGVAWLPGPPKTIAAFAGIPASLLFGALVAAIILLHLRGRRLAKRRHLLGEARD